MCWTTGISCSRARLTTSRPTRGCSRPIWDFRGKRHVVARERGGYRDWRYRIGQSLADDRVRVADRGVLAAIRDAGLDPKEIDGIIPIGMTGAPAEAFVTNFGIPDLRFSALTPLGGASPVAAVQCAIA